MQLAEGRNRIAPRSVNSHAFLVATFGNPVGIKPFHNVNTSLLRTVQLSEGEEGCPCMIIIFPFRTQTDLIFQLLPTHLTFFQVQLINNGGSTSVLSK
ncbi:hypothetical protein CDAR_433191 [Caerostris darwini]|uniref:Uncharacterized protein n=1 Tax=Caerostris darwini TaxID=1538125 RepID=A0AAV4QEX6_9ARAC|nr:hypothetical protein CDAR_433191 [Caerostris darwini]